MILGILASQISGHLTATSPVAGYKLWLDGADTSKITLSGSAVTQWTDKSANAYTFTQGTSTYRPTSGLNTQNGKNILDFDYNRNLQSTAAASTWNFLHNGTEHTIFFAVDSNTNGDMNLMNTNQATTQEKGFYIWQGNPNYISHVVTNGTSGNPSVANNTANYSLTLNFTYVTIIGKPSNATAANRSDVRFKQGSAVKNNTATTAVSTANCAQSLMIGDYLQGAGVGWTGKIGEIIIYDSALSSADILTNQQYLAAKWNV